MTDSKNQPEIKTSRLDKLQKVGTTDNKKLEVEIGLFNSIPDTIDGCGDFYSFEINNKNRRTYVMLSNLTQFSMMKINGVTEYFMIEQDTLTSIDDNHYLQKASSSKYELNCDFQLLKKYDEGGLYKMILTLIDKTTRRKKVMILVGESGC